MSISKQGRCDRFNAKVSAGNVIRVWPGIKEGDGIRAEVLGPAYVAGNGKGDPWVPVRYLEGRRPGGTDHIFLTHASTKVEPPAEQPA